MKTWLQKLWWRLLDWWGARRLLVNEAKQEDAQLAVNRVVYMTRLPFDCVTAGVMRGGACIKVKHDDAWEVFIHRSYREAADEAITWVRRQGDELSYRTASKASRRERRAFDSIRRGVKRKLK